MGAIDRPSRAITLAIATLLVGLVGGCGGSSEPRARATTTALDNLPSPPAAPRKGAQAGPILTPTVSLLTPGVNRFAFMLFGKSRRQLTGAKAVVYVQPSGSSRVLGPFRATEESLEAAPRFRSGHGDDVGSLYVTQLRFPGPGAYAIVGVASVGGRRVMTEPALATVSASNPVPAVGQPAPRIPTPTVASVHGDVAEIDTRTPPDSMHEVSLDDVLGRKPVILLFASPRLCQNSSCGPVTDITEEVESERPGAAVFIHNELYLGNTILPGCIEGSRPEAECVRPQVVAYHLQTAPWLFAIDRHGRIAARLEGAFGKPELEAALHAALTR